MHGVPRISLASEKEISGGFSGNLMERILSRGNMFFALKRVERNYPKGRIQAQSSKKG